MRRIAAVSISIILMASACASGDDSADEDTSSGIEAEGSEAPSQDDPTSTGSEAPSEDDPASPDTEAADITEDDGGEAESEVTVAEAQDIDADQATAEAALLTLSDFPAGWSEVADTEEDDEELTRRQAECFGLSGTSVIDTEARAETGLFTDPGDGTQVSEVVGLMASVDAATATLAGFNNDDVTLCLTEVFNDRFRVIIEESIDMDEAEVGDITVGALNITPVGDESYAFRVEIPISVGAFSLNPTADIVAVRVGRSLAGLNFFSEDGATPIELIDEFTALAASRLPEDAAAATESPETDPEPTTNAAAQVESLLSFNSVEPASFPDAVPGEVSIVSVLDPSGRDSGLLVLRNGTEQTLTGFEVSVTGRDAAGTLIATGSDQGSVEPTMIGPGELAIASVYMGGEELPTGTDFEYEIVGVQTDAEFVGSVSVPIIETSLAGAEVLGVVENATDKEVSGPISVLYICLGSDTEITGYAAAFADQDPLAPGATSPFRATIYRGETCDRSIAGASGWDF